MGKKGVIRTLDVRFAGSAHVGRKSAFPCCLSLAVLDVDVNLSNFYEDGGAAYVGVRSLECNLERRREG